MFDEPKTVITPRRRAHLELLAGYLERLPADYAHFEMGDFIGHEGVCQDIERGYEDETYVKSPEGFLSNCGTVACAIGHAPAAGIPLSKTHIGKTDVYDWDKGGTVYVADIDWYAYSKRNFFESDSNAWQFLFGGEWSDIDNHHYGAAARIRYLLDKGEVPMTDDGDGPYYWTHAGLIDLYAPYRVDAQQVAA